METKKTRFWRTVIVTVGILPGIWFFVGFDPEAQINMVVFNQIVKVFSSFIGTTMIQDVSVIGASLFFITGLIGTGVTWAGVYELGGGWGILAVAAAWLGGVLIAKSIGIWLIIGALLSAPFLPVDKDYS